MTKKGLILEGGAMRGLFTAGVMDVLMENGIVFDGIIGVSAGAAFGCNYKSGQIGRVLRYNLRFCRDKRYCGISSLLKSGNIYNTDFCYGEVPLELDKFDFDAYLKKPAEFYVVCTDIESGKPVYHKYTGREDSGFDWIRASASMPIVSQVVNINGQKLLDGGLSDSIPIRYFESIGYNKNVAVLTQTKEYRKGKNHMMPLIRRKYRKYPKLIAAAENRFIMYNAEKEYASKREKEGELFVIRPDEPIPVSKVEKNPKKLKHAYEIGRDTAIKKMDSLKAYLSL